jgi:hypothetical protein
MNTFCLYIFEANEVHVWKSIGEISNVAVALVRAF